MTREEELDWLCRLRSDISYMDFSIDMEVSLERKKQYRQALSEVIKALEQEPIDYKTQYENYLKKSEVVISQLRADRDRLQDAFDKLRAEIVDLGQRTMNDNRASGIWACRDIIDKYKAEMEDKE